MTTHSGTAQGVLLVGHGAVARDCPRQLVARFKLLEGQRRARGGEACAEERALDDRIRRWPRTDQTDPYRAGLEALAAGVRQRLNGTRVAVAYNEFCAPTIEEAAAALIAEGVRDLTVVPSMITPGGVHSELEIPAAVEGLRGRHPDVTIRYAWPFDLGGVAQLLVEHIQRFA